MLLRRRHVATKRSSGRVSGRVSGRLNTAPRLAIPIAAKGSSDVAVSRGSHVAIAQAGEGLSADTKGVASGLLRWTIVSSPEQHSGEDRSSVARLLAADAAHGPKRVIWPGRTREGMRPDMLLGRIDEGEGAPCRKSGT